MKCSITTSSSLKQRRNALLAAAVLSACSALATAMLATVAHAQIVTTIAGGGVVTTDGGQATAARLIGPSSLARDRLGRLLIAERFGCKIRAVDASGVISTIAGTGTCATGADGILAVNSGLNNPSSVTVDAVGNIYVVEHLGHVIRKIDVNGIITRVAGTGVAGYTGNGLAATGARLRGPFKGKFDAAGNFVFTEYENFVVRKVSPAGIISLVAGTNAFGRDPDGNDATASRLARTLGMTFDAIGNLYVVDDDFPSRISKIGLDGKLNTFLIGVEFPLDMAFDNAGNMYISGGGSNRISKRDRNGVVTFILGNGNHPDGGDFGPAANARTLFPDGLLIEPDGSLIFASLDGGRVRKIAAPSMSISTTNAAPGIAASTTFNAQLANTALTGTMTFQADGLDIAGCEAVPLVLGAASCTTSFGQPGGRKITAGYSGMATTSIFPGTYSTIGATAALSISVQGPVSVNLGLSPATAGLGTIIPAGAQLIDLGRALSFSVTANPRHVIKIMGNCDWKKTSGPIALVPIGTGTETFEVNVGGACSLEAAFTPLIPKANVNTEMAANALFTATERSQVYVAPTSPAQTTSIVGAPVKLKAWMTDIAGVPYPSATNVITFKANGIAIAGCINVPLTLRGSNVLHIREASCTTAFTPAGNVAITSEFAGDTYNFPAVSGALNHSVTVQ